MTTAVKPNGFRALSLGTNMFREAQRRKMSLSALLEEDDPSEGYVESGLKDLDAYERQLVRYGIRTSADLKLMRPASTLEEFMKPDERFFTDDAEKQRFFASDTPPSWILYPEFINRQLRMVPLPDDVLADIVSITTPIDGDVYRAIYLVDGIQSGRANRQFGRVEEGAEIPHVTIATHEQGVRLHKYGIGLRGSYETYRRLRVDLFGIMLGRMRSQIQLDLATHAIDVIQSGDGNGNAAANTNVLTYDPTAPAGPGTVTDPVTGATSSITKKLTYQAWLSFRASLYPLAMTTVVGRLNELEQILTLQFPNVDPMTLLALLQQPDQRVQTGTLTMSVNVFGQAVNLVYLPWAPGGVLIGMDKRFAVEQLVENNANITETDKDVHHQLNDIVISQVVGFDKFLPEASKQLTFV